MGQKGEVKNDSSSPPTDVCANLDGVAAFKLSQELTDVGQYAYSALCAYCLYRLFGDHESHRSFQEKTLKSLVSHLKLSPQVLEAMLAIAKGACGMENADAFVDTLRMEKIALDHGVIIYPQDLLLQTLKDGCYDSRLRVLAKYMCLLLRIEWSLIEEYEDLVMGSMQEEEHQVSPEEAKEKADKEKKRKIKRYALIGLATVGGGTLIGLTGGLAAPFIAAGAGAIIGGAGAAALGSTAGIAIIGSLFGVAGAGLTGFKMKKRVGGIEEFVFEPLTEGRQLHITIAISGWLNEENPDFKTAWKCLANSEEQYVLRYESKYLKQMGAAMSYLYKFAINTAAQEALKYTVLQGLLAAIAWPATLLTASSVIDNPWSVCTSRTINAGRQLADVLLSRQQGKRPVTLVGFSLGARVIFYCLEEMAKRKNCEGIIEDVIMLGAPVTGNPKNWAPFEKVVSGRIVNGYCRGDWLLKFLYRTASVQMTIAGLMPVKWENRRMHNIDLSDVVNGHLDYMAKIKDILDVVSVNTKEVPRDESTDSLKQWVQIRKDATSKPVKSPSGNFQLKPTSDCNENLRSSAENVSAPTVSEPEVAKNGKEATSPTEAESAEPVESPEGVGGSVEAKSQEKQVEDEATKLDEVKMGEST